jgi:hypothetical protein
MHRAIEFHDSKLATITVSGLSCVLKLRPAYVHESDGEAGVDPGKGYIQDIDITFDGASAAGLPNALPVDLSFGELSVAGIPTDKLPIEVRGEVVLRLLTVANQEVIVESSRAHSTYVGNAKFVEKFPGAEIRNQSAKPTQPMGG